MSQENETGPVDTGAKQIDIAANIKAEADEKAKVDEAVKDAEEALDAVDQVEAEVQENTEDSADSDGDDTTARRGKKPGVHNRIDQLTREKYENARRAEAAERQLQMMQAQLAQQQQGLQQGYPQQDQLQQEATLEDFNYDWNAYLSYREQRMQQASIQQFESYQRQQEEQRQQQESLNAFRGRVAALESTQPGAWAAAEAAPIAWTDAMLQVIQSAESGPHIAVYLSQHLDEADAISRMRDPFQQALALGRIEASLATRQAPPPQRKTVTQAPEPVKTLTADTQVRKSLDEMTMAEYVAYRDSQEKSR